MDKKSDEFTPRSLAWFFISIGIFLFGFGITIMFVPIPIPKADDPVRMTNGSWAEPGDSYYKYQLDSKRKPLGDSLGIPIHVRTKAEVEENIENNKSAFGVIFILFIIGGVILIYYGAAKLQNLKEDSIGKAPPK